MLKLRDIFILSASIVLSIAMTELLVLALHPWLGSWGQGLFIFVTTFFQACVWTGILLLNKPFSFWKKFMGATTHARAWSLIAIGIAILWMFRTIILSLLERIPFFKIGLQELYGLFSFSTAWEYFLFGFTAVIIAPIIEEIIFRGFVYKTMRSYWSPWVAILASAFIFGLVHYIPLYALNAFLVGIPLAWVYEKSKSLWPPIIFHITNNALVFILMIVFGKMI